MDGTLLRSQACVIGNRRTLGDSPAKQELARRLIERIEGHLEAGHYFRITANVRGNSPEQVARAILDRKDLAGLKGPTVAQVYTPEGDSWFAITVVVPQSALQDALDYLRAVGGIGISVLQPRYVYHGASPTFQRLQQALRGGR